MSENNGWRGDRIWKHQCRNFPAGVGAMGGWPQNYFGKWRWANGFQNWWHKYLHVECPTGYVMAGHKSMYRGSLYLVQTIRDRRFQWACRKLPPGITMTEKGDWTNG